MALVEVAAEAYTHCVGYVEGIPRSEWAFEAGNSNQT